MRISGNPLVFAFCTVEVIQPFLHPVNSSSCDNFNSSKFLCPNYSSRFQKQSSIDPKGVFSFILHSIFYMFSNTGTRSLASPMHSPKQVAEANLVFLMDLTWSLGWAPKAIRHLTSDRWEICGFFLLDIENPTTVELADTWVPTGTLEFPTSKVSHLRKPGALRSHSPIHHTEPIQSGASQIWSLSKSQECGCGKWLHGFWCCHHYKQGLVLAFRPCKGLWCITYRQHIRKPQR